MKSNVRIASAVGLLAHRSAILEGAVAVAAHGLAGVSQQIGRIAISNSVDVRLKIISSLTAHHGASPEAAAVIEEWCREVRAAYQIRSRVLHSVLIPTDDLDRGIVVDQKPLGELKTWSLAEIEATSERMRALAEEGFSPIVMTMMELYPHSLWAVSRS